MEKCNNDERRMVNLIQNKEVFDQIEQKLSQLKHEKKLAKQEEKEIKQLREQVKKLDTDMEPQRQKYKEIKKSQQEMDASIKERNELFEAQQKDNDEKRQEICKIKISLDAMKLEHEKKMIKKMDENAELQNEYEKMKKRYEDATHNPPDCFPKDVKSQMREQEHKYKVLKEDIAAMEKQYEEQKAIIEGLEKDIHDIAKQNKCTFSIIGENEENTVPSLLKEEAINQQCLQQQHEEIKKHENQGLKLRQQNEQLAEKNTSLCSKNQKYAASLKLARDTCEKLRNQRQELKLLENRLITKKEMLKQKNKHLMLQEAEIKRRCNKALCKREESAQC